MNTTPLAYQLAGHITAGAHRRELFRHGWAAAAYVARAGISQRRRPVWHF